MAIMAICLCVAPAFAQSIKPEKATKIAADTSLNQDTVVVPFVAINSKIKGFQATVTKLTGTIAGGVYLQGTIDGTNWVNIGTNDTLIVTGTIATKIWPITTTNYHSYRAWYRSSGSQTSTLTFSYLRRTDE